MHHLQFKTSKVTLFGNSAGAQSVMLHTVSKKSGDYFHKTIQQSNPAVYDYMNVERALNWSAEFITDLKCEENYKSVAECLRLKLIFVYV